MDKRKVTAQARKLQPFMANVGGNVVTEVMNAAAGPGIDIPAGTNTIGLGGDSVLIYHAGLTPVSEFDATEAGVTAALAAAVSGDTVQLPSAAIGLASAIALPDGVTLRGISREATVLSGKITLGDGSTIESLSVIRTANDENALVGVDGPDSGTAKVIGCRVSCAQSGTGIALGVRIGDDGSVEVWNSDLAGSSLEGDGYAGGIDGGDGNLIQIGGSAIGSTTPYLEVETSA